MSDTAVHIATVRNYDPSTFQASVVIPALYGDALLAADAYVYRKGEESSLPALQPSDQVLVFFDGGYTTTTPKWFASLGGGSGPGGPIDEHEHEADPHSQYATDVDLAQHVSSVNPHPNLNAGFIAAGTLPAARLTGNYDINVTGSAAKWTTPRLITLTGSVTGSTTFDGSGNIVMSTFISEGISLGANVPLGQSVNDDGKDHGVRFLWNNGSAGSGFFGWDRSTNKFVFIPDATEGPSDVFSGNRGEIDATLNWSNVLSKPSPTLTINLTGAVSASGAVTLAQLLSNTLNLTTTLGGDVVQLGGNTVGDYVASITGTPNQVIIAGTPMTGETARLVLQLPQDIGTESSPIFSQLRSSAPTGTPPLTVLSSTMVVGLNVERLGGQTSAYHRDWTNLTNKPSPIMTVALTGPVSGSANMTWTNLSGNMSLSIATTLAGGPGSGVNADLLDGQHGAFYQDATNMIAGILPPARLNGTYTINVAGNVTGALTGNASTATALQNMRTIAGMNFNGTQDITLFTLTRGTYLTGSNYNGSAATTWAVDAATTNTASKVVARDAAGSFAANLITGVQFISTRTTGTGAPLQLSSQDLVSNLNSDLLDGKHGTDFAFREELESLLGDLVFVGLYDAEAYIPSNERAIHFNAATPNTLTGWSYDPPTDASIDFRSDCTIPTMTTGEQRILTGSMIIRFTQTQLLISFYDSTGAFATVTVLYSSIADWPGAGARVQVRAYWNAATDTFTAYWRGATTADLLDDTGWVAVGSAVFTGKQVYDPGLSLTVGGQASLYFTGDLYRLVLKTNGATALDLRATDAAYRGVPSFTSTSGQLFTLNPTSAAPGPNAAGAFMISNPGIPAPAWSPQGPENMLRNSSFESGAQQPDGLWVAAQAGTLTSYTKALVTTGAHSGSTFVRLTAAGIDGTEGAFLEQLVGTQSTPRISVGTAYTFSSFLKGTLAANTYIQMIILWLNATGGTISQTTANVATLTSTWAQAAVTGIAPALATHCRVGVRLYGNASAVNATVTCDVDSCQFTATSTAPPTYVPTTGEAYRHGMYWIAESNGNVDFVDADLSGRYEVGVDEPVGVFEGDWIVAIDPLVDQPGHKIGTALSYSEMVFQWIPFSAETFVKSQVQIHREEIDPHLRAGYAKMADVVAGFMPINKNFDVDIAKAILALKQDAGFDAANPVTGDPFPNYLNVSRGNALYMPKDKNFAQDIADAIARLRDPILNPDPFSQYLNLARADLRYENKGAVQSLLLQPDPFPQYLTLARADARYDATGAVAAHEAKPDPHSQYLNVARGDARYFLNTITFDDRYYTKQQVLDLVNTIEDDVLTTDGAPSAKIWIGDKKKPAGVKIGDIVFQTTNIGLRPPGPGNGFIAVSYSSTSINLAWGVWPASAVVTSINLEWSPNGVSGWTPVSGSPLAASATSYLDTTSITQNTLRYYRLGAVNITGFDPAAYTIVSTSSLNDPPPPPTALVVSAPTVNSITLSWTAPSWPDPGGPNARYEMFLDDVSIGFAFGTGTSHIFTGLVDNRRYKLGVRSRDVGGLTSSIVSIGPAASTSTSNAAPTQQATALAISLPTANLPNVAVSWTAPASLPADFLRYDVELIRSSDSVVIQSTTTTGTSVLFTNTVWGTAVKFRVRVTDNLLAAGPFVTSVNAVTTMADPVPSVPVWVVDKTNINVSWTAPAVLPADFVQYRLYEYNGMAGTPGWEFPLAATSMAWTGMPYSSQRRYSVRVERSGTLAPSTSAISTMLTIMADPAPVSVNLTASGTTVTATWGNPGVKPNDATGYRVRFKNSASAVINEQVLGANTLSVIYPNQSYSTTYGFDVRLERANGQHSSYVGSPFATTGPQPDSTPPGDAWVYSWEPEGSYGAMVVRAQLPGDGDFNRYWVDVNDGAGGEWNAVGYTYASPGQHIAHYVLDGSGLNGAGRYVYVRVNVMDAVGNPRWGPWVSRYLLVSPLVIDASHAGTWRTETGGWRNDAAVGLNQTAQGRTVSGENYACFFYGTAVQDWLGGRNIYAAYVEYFRINSGGIGGGQQPMFWCHSLVDRNGDPRYSFSDAGVGEYDRLGTAVYRHPSYGGPIDGYWWLHPNFFNSLKNGNARGIGQYRYGESSDPGNPRSWYMIQAGNPGEFSGYERVHGRLNLFHYG